MHLLIKAGVARGTTTHNRTNTQVETPVVQTRQQRYFTLRPHTDTPQQDTACARQAAHTQWLLTGHTLDHAHSLQHVATYEPPFAFNYVQPPIHQQLSTVLMLCSPCTSCLPPATLHAACRVHEVCGGGGGSCWCSYAYAGRISIHKPTHHKMVALRV